MNDRAPLADLAQPTPLSALAPRYRAIRAATQSLAAPLSAEDCAIQSMPDASPVKWHLAHTRWFFETFVLEPHVPGYRFYDAAYAPARTVDAAASAPPLAWVEFGEGLVEIGHDSSGFAFDNETPRHRQYLPAFALASRPVTNAEYAAFVADDGYRRAELWLSEGWDWTNANG